MNEIEKVKQQLDVTPILLADAESDVVQLITEGAAVQNMLDGDRPALLVHARRALDNFVKLNGAGIVGGTYRRDDVGKVAGVGREAIYKWLREGILLPSVRPSMSGKGNGPIYSWTDLWCAALIGMARRQGMPLSVLKQIQPLFVDQEKRTDQTVEASSRS